VIEKPKKVTQTPERYGFAPKNIREIIKKNREQMIDRVNLLNIMKQEE